MHRAATVASPRVFGTLADWEAFRPTIPQSVSIGFVPTMGALHAGHRSLLDRARSESDVVVLSIFVNPTQFDSPDDLAAYPSTLDDDLSVADEAGVDHVLMPDRAQVYADGYRYHVIETEFSKELCGAHRPGHFDGVLTVVLKLLNLVAPRRAYFGEKDFQQLTLVRDMVAAFFLPIEIVGCPTVREADGLALSSRNRRLSPEARRQASLFPRLLQSDLPPDEVRRKLGDDGFEVDYIVDRDGRRFGAVHLDDVRLIDNVKLA